MKILSARAPRTYTAFTLLLNGGPWNPALHPRNSIGEFIYTDGGLHGRSAKKSFQAINASNYAVGVYMNGAGANPWETLAVARIAADLSSKNAGSPALREWQSFGWKAAEAQEFIWNKAK